MKPKHTPGPWEVFHSAARGTPIQVSVPIEAPMNGGEFICMPMGERRIANAHLIAAAPELLEALRDLNRAIIAHIKPGTILVDKRLCAAHLAALKAMGKATCGTNE